MTENPDRLPQNSEESNRAIFESRRHQAVTAPDGALALVNTQWITGDPDAGQPIWGVTGIWSPDPRGEGMVLSATRDDDIRVDGQLVTGTIALAAGVSRLRFSPTVTGTIVAGDGAQRGDYALQIWDSASPANLQFGSIETYPEDPHWVLSAIFEPLDGASGQDGEVVFTHANVNYRLAAHRENDAVTVLFGDATNGESTYSVGRYLKVPLPEGTHEEITVVSLDFNRAWLPSCAFSYGFPCPLVPAANRLPFPVLAGERNVLALDGSPLHE